MFSVVEFEFIDHAAIFVSCILYLDRCTVEEVIACFSEVGVETLAMIAGGEGMLRLIPDFGIEARRLHRGHHTGQSHHVCVIGVVECLELYAGADEALQFGKVLNCHRLSLLFLGIHVTFPPSSCPALAAVRDPPADEGSPHRRSRGQYCPQFCGR